MYFSTFFFQVSNREVLLGTSNISPLKMNSRKYLLKHSAINVIQTSHSQGCSSIQKRTGRAAVTEEVKSIMATEMVLRALSVLVKTKLWKDPWKASLAR